MDKRGPHARMLIPELDLEVQAHLRDDLPLDSRLPVRLTGVNLAELEAHFRVEG